MTMLARARGGMTGPTATVTVTVTASGRRRVGALDIQTMRRLGTISSSSIAAAQCKGTWSCRAVAVAVAVAQQRSRRSHCGSLDRWTISLLQPSEFFATP